MSYVVGLMYLFWIFGVHFEIGSDAIHLLYLSTSNSGKFNMRL